MYPPAAIDRKNRKFLYQHLENVKRETANGKRSACVCMAQLLNQCF